jgi:hypothetical protein
MPARAPPDSSNQLCPLPIGQLRQGATDQTQQRHARRDERRFVHQVAQHQAVPDASYRAGSPLERPLVSVHQGVALRDEGRGFALLPGHIWSAVDGALVWGEGGDEGVAQVGVSDDQQLVSGVQRGAAGDGSSWFWRTTRLIQASSGRPGS